MASQYSICYALAMASLIRTLGVVGLDAVLVVLVTLLARRLDLVTSYHALAEVLGPVGVLGRVALNLQLPPLAIVAPQTGPLFSL
jgi:hypothetical protein